MAKSAKRRARFTHIIRKNSKVYVPLERIYVDCEAHRNPIAFGVEKQTLWFGWACYERVRTDKPSECVTEDWLRFEESSVFWDWCAGKALTNHRLLIYAHNLGYDAAILSLASNAERSGWKMTDYVTSTHLMWVEFTKDGKKLLFLDTLNYFGVSLKSLGAGIGFDKLTMPELTETPDSWDVYCKRDVEVIRSAMHAYYELLETEDLGHYQNTLASQAFGAWRHRFMDYKVLVVADNELSALERRAYHGGRTEVFYDREIVGSTHCLDINAMYPAVMASNLYPIRKVRKGDTATLTELGEMLNWGCVIADVTITTDEPIYPVRTNDRIIFPVGTFETTLTTRELRYALYHGHIQSIGQWALYEDALLFREFSLTLHRLRWHYRDTDNPAFAYMCKIMNNSLYGKFGQRGIRWLNCSDPPIPGIHEAIGICDESLGSLTHRLRFGVWQHQVKDSEAFESFPAIAAHITADARMRLWQLISRAGREHVFYCDTDSVYCDPIGYKHIADDIDVRMLGALKHEGTYTSVHFRAPKDYRLDGKRRIKGVRDSAWEVRDGYYEQVQFESYDQVLARGDDGYIIVTNIAKRVTRVNHQSQGNGLGWRSPLELPAG